MKIRSTLAVLVALVAIAPPSFADTELVMSSWLPARHPIVINAIQPWAEQVNEVTEGRVTVRILGKPLGAPPAHYDLAKDGVADVTYGLHSFTRDDRFLRSRVGQFSFITTDAVKTSEAFWDIYAGQLDASAEHEGVKLLGLFVHEPGMLHNSKRRIETTEDLAGLKIRVPGGYIADLAGDLGATTVFVSPLEVYEQLSRGVIDGATFTYEALTALNLAGDIRYTMLVPGGLYNTTWFLVMNDDKWAEISAEDQAAIEAVSGPAFASLVGQAWVDADANAKTVIEAEGIEIYDASPAIVDAIKPIAETYEADWAAAVDAQGFDGAAALKDLRAKSGIAK